MWDQWAAEMAAPEAASGRRPRRHRHRWLLPTRGAAIIATLGWVGLVLAQMMLLGALVPSFDLGDTRNFLVPLDEHAWFGATTIVSATAAYLGWLWWTVSAAFNVRRVSPLSTSPVLPIVVYLLAPIGRVVHPCQFLNAESQVSSHSVPHRARMDKQYTTIASSGWHPG